MYVDYAYYSNEYGGELEEKDFRKASRWAEAYIRSLTCAKGDIFSAQNDMVKDAVCVTAETYTAFWKERAEGGAIKTEHNDGYVVTYVTEQEDGQLAEDVLKKKAYRAVRAYLLPTGWLSRGMGYVHDHKCNINSI